MNDIILISVSKLDLQKMIIDCLDICLKEYKIRKPLIASADRRLSVYELCKYHPDHPCSATVFNWVRKNKIPFHRNEPGQRKLFFLKSEIDEFIKSGNQKNISQSKK